MEVNAASLKVKTRHRAIVSEAIAHGDRFNGIVQRTIYTGQIYAIGSGANEISRRREGLLRGAQIGYDIRCQTSERRKSPPDDAIKVDSISQEVSTARLAAVIFELQILLGQLKRNKEIRSRIQISNLQSHRKVSKRQATAPGSIGTV